MENKKKLILSAKTLKGLEVRSSVKTGTGIVSFDGNWCVRPPVPSPPTTNITCKW